MEYLITPFDNPYDQFSEPQKKDIMYQQLSLFITI